MRIAYFDCFSGASGDMILGSMIDAGLSPGGLREELKKLRLRNVSLKVKKADKQTTSNIIAKAAVFLFDNGIR